jgi:thiol-disulfide isomerase/thioredoxin
VIGALLLAAAIGSAAPAFAVDGITGEQITLGQFSGRPLYINIFATWCPPCRSEIPRLVQAAARQHGKVAFLFVDEQEPAASVQRFARAFAMPAPIGIDGGALSSAYGSVSIPESVFIDATGRVRAIVRGPIDDATLAHDLQAIGGT